MQAFDGAYTNMKLGNVAIWGCGNDGRRLYEAIKGNFRVACFIDTHAAGEQFDGVNVISFQEFEDIRETESLVILIGTKKYEKEITSILNKNSYRVGEDYLPYDIVFGDDDLILTSIDYFLLRKFLCEKEAIELVTEVMQRTHKKCTILYGNCQMRPLSSCLRHNRSFNRDYLIIKIPPFFEYNSPKEKELFEEGFWNLCDLLISQRVKNENKISPRLSTECVEKRLRKDAQIIWIPNIYFNGYFPQLCANGHNVYLNDGDEGLFPIGDKYIDTLEEDGLSTQEILERISNPNFFNSEEIIGRCEHSLKELKKREELCSILMSDYVEENYKKWQLFYSPNHPINKVIYEESRRILEQLGYKNTTIEQFDLKPLVGMDNPIYPSVVKILGLREKIEKSNANTAVWGFCGDFLEFSKKYIEICWENNEEDDKTKDNSNQSL